MGCIVFVSLKKENGLEVCFLLYIECSLRVNYMITRGHYYFGGIVDFDDYSLHCNLKDLIFIADLLFD